MSDPVSLPHQLPLPPGLSWVISGRVTESQGSSCPHPQETEGHRGGGHLNSQWPRLLVPSLGRLGREQPRGSTRRLPAHLAFDPPATLGGGFPFYGGADTCRGDMVHPGVGGRRAFLQGLPHPGQEPPIALSHIVEATARSLWEMQLKDNFILVLKKNPLKSMHFFFHSISHDLLEGPSYI